MTTPPKTIPQSRREIDIEISRHPELGLTEYFRTLSRAQLDYCARAKPDVAVQYRFRSLSPALRQDCLASNSGSRAALLHRADELLPRELDICARRHPVVAHRLHREGKLLLDERLLEFCAAAPGAGEVVRPSDGLVTLEF